MPHPNDDFIKKFLGESARAPQPKPEIAKKQKQQNYEKTVKGLLETTRSAILPSEVKRTLQKQKIQEKPEVVSESVKFLTEKLANEPKTKIPSKIESKLKELYEQMEGIWQPQILPQGLFYYNKMTGQWMNSFGIIKNKLDEFLSLMDESSGDGSRVVPSPPIPPNPITLVKVLSFSDEGSYLAGYAEDTEENGYINVYSLNYGASVTPTLEHTITLGGITFDGATGQRCLVSESGEYVVLASPDIKTVYFFDSAADSLLQTITEDYPQFGEKIAADKDFYGMAISTNELTRTVNSYDGRITSYSISSPICYYKRNFGSSGPQQFKKIHSHNAHTNSRSNGLASWDGVSKKINLNDYYNNPPTGSLYNTCSINRCDDIAVKGYNFALSSIALEEDQITYRAQFPNLSNPRFDVIKEAGFTFQPNYTDAMAYKMFGATGGITFLGFPGVVVPLQTFSDEYLANTSSSNYFMEGTLGLKNFTIIRKINNNFVSDGSYLDPATIAVVYAPELRSKLGTSLSQANPAYNFNFMSKMYVKQVTPFSDNATARPSTPAFGAQWDNIERRNYIREEVVNAKTAINGTDVYTVSKYITNSANVGSGVTAATENLNIANIRIYRFPSTNTQGTDSYLYNDWGYTGATFTQEPNSAPYGWLKVMYDVSNQSDLESSLVRSGSDPVWGPVATPVLADPSDCPNSEFAYTINSSILQQEILSCKVSEDRLFVNFASNTMIFVIDNTEDYKPLLFETTLDESLDQYSFTYNDSGEFFTYQNTIYKYNRSTHELDIVTTIG